MDYPNAFLSSCKSSTLGIGRVIQSICRNREPDVAQLQPPASLDPYVSRGEQAIVCSDIGLAFALLLGLTSNLQGSFAAGRADRSSTSLDCNRHVDAAQ